MISTGSIILTHANGWACAKECTYGMEFDKTPDGKAKGTGVFQPKKMFECVGNMSNSEQVDGAFLGDDGLKITFKGYLQGKERVVVTSAIGNEFQSIIKKIKLWQENYKVS